MSYVKTMKTIILKSIARTLFVSAWASWNAQYGNTNVSGKDLMELAPETPDFMADHAQKVLTGWLEKNNISEKALIYLAKETWGLGVATDEKIMEAAGQYLAMESMGSGVSWLDNNDDWHLEPFHYDFSYFDIPDNICPVPDEE